MATVKCLRCNKNFQAQRSSAKYCSDSCRVMYKQSGTKMEHEKLKAIKAIQNIISLLDDDSERWGHEAHYTALEMNEAISKLYARTDFLGPSKLKDDRWKR